MLCGNFDVPILDRRSGELTKNRTSSEYILEVNYHLNYFGNGFHMRIEKERKKIS